MILNLMPDDRKESTALPVLQDFLDSVQKRSEYLYDAVLKLMNQDISLYLTGSYFFRTMHEDSDIDFFAVNNYQSITALRYLLFEKDKTQSYWCGEVYVLELNDGREKIHVQLLSQDECERKRHVQANMMMFLWHDDIKTILEDKPRAKRFWSFAMNL